MPVLYDPVQSVVKSVSLTHKVTKNVVGQTQNEVRAMKIRHRLGTFGKSDQELGRAAALLEYVAREAGGLRIPMKLLAKAACMNDKKFTQYHKHIGNFRQVSYGAQDAMMQQARSQRASSASSRSSQQRAKSVLSSSSASKTATSSTAAKTAATKLAATSSPQPRTRQHTRNGLRQSSIPALAIKLGAVVNDPIAFSNQAQQLFQDLIEHARSLGRDAGRQLHDMIRYQDAYEAACFYLVANKERVLAVATKQSSEDREKTTLDIDDIIAASIAFTPSLFKEILKHCESLRHELGNKKVQSKANGVDGANGMHGAKKRRVISTTTASTSTTAVTAASSRDASGNANAADQDDTMRAMSTSLKGVVDGATSRAKHRLQQQQQQPQDRDKAEAEEAYRLQFHPNFWDWKEKTLKSAIRQGRQLQIEQQTKEQRQDDAGSQKSMTESTLSRFQSLQAITTSILEKL